jgi:flagellar protein FlaG
MSELVNLRAQQLTELQQPKGKDLPKAAAKQAELNRQTQIEGEVKEETSAKLNESEVEQAVSNLNDYIQNTQRKLNFSLDEESGLTIVKVFNADNGELIRQIPSEDAVSLAQKLNHDEPLMLFSAQV